MSDKKVDENGTELTCGIIMPIASMPGYSSEHWQDVKNIIKESTHLIDDYNFVTEIVSNSDGEIDVIHKRIIQNVYNSDIVVCDISGKNPNVLFELGMRLTFDKPTVIIKDDATDYIFDTGVIEHVTYPKDLRFNKIVEFKKVLSEKIKKTFEKSQSDATFSPFLGNFGTYSIPKIEQKEVSTVDELILDELRNMRTELNRIKRDRLPVGNPNNKSNKPILDIDSAIRNYLQTNNCETLDPEYIFNSSKFQNYLQERFPFQIDIKDNYQELLNKVIIEQAKLDDC